MFSSSKKNKKKSTGSSRSSSSSTDSGHKHHHPPILKQKEANKIIQESLSPKVFYSITAESQRTFERCISILQQSTDDFLNGKSSVDLELLQRLGLFKSIDSIFRTSHAQGHLAGRAGVISHDGIADRERRLLAVVQRMARRTNLAEDLSIQYEFLTTLILRLRSMLKSLKKYSSNQGHDGVIEDDLDDSDEEDARTLRSAPKSRPSSSSSTGVVPTLPKVMGATTTEGEEKKILDVKVEVEVETRMYEFEHTFETNSSLGIRIVDRAKDLIREQSQGKTNKKNKNKKNNNNKNKKNKKNNFVDDHKIGIFVGGIIDYGQADNLNRMFVTVSKKHVDKEVRKDDKIVEISGKDVSQASAEIFVQILKETGGSEKKPVKITFRGKREVKKKKKKKKKKVNGNELTSALVKTSKTSSKTSSSKTPTAPMAPSPSGTPRKGRRHRLVHKKGSLGGGKSEKGGRVRAHADIHAIADAAVHSVDSEATSMKAKGLAVTWIKSSVSKRRLIVRGVNLLNRISFHLNALSVLLEVKVVKNFLMNSASAGAPSAPSAAASASASASTSETSPSLLTSLFNSTLDMLQLFERYTHPHEEFVIEPLIQIIFRLSGGDNSKKVKDLNQLKSWSAASPGSETNSSAGARGAPSNFTESFMACSTLWQGMKLVQQWKLFVFLFFVMSFFLI
jgi:hypothetical protein